MLLLAASFALAEEEQDRVQEIKTAFIYNFCKFIQWPEDKIEDANQPFVIGVFGDSPIKDTLGNLENKKIKNKKIIVKYFKGLADSELSKSKKEAKLESILEKLSKPHILYISKTEKDYFQKLTYFLAKNNLLVISTHPEFLNSGGMINFVMQKNRIHFELNTAAIKRSNLTVSSKIMRLAVKIIEEDQHSEKHRKSCSLYEISSETNF
jgi:hypothetical protein